MAWHETGARKFRDLLALTFRALMLPSLWNERTLQGAGYAWALNAVRPSGVPGQRVGDMACFNTTPAMAPCVIGAVAKMERDGAAREDVLKVRDSGAASVAGIGDQLFPGSVRPTAALAGLVAIPFGPLVAVACLLLAQNLPQAAFRLLGAYMGLSRGKAAIPGCIMSARRTLRVWRVAGWVLLGALSGAVLAGLDRSYGTGGGLIALAAVPAMSWLISSAGARPSRICLVLLASSGILSLIAGS